MWPRPNLKAHRFTDLQTFKFLVLTSSNLSASQGLMNMFVSASAFARKIDTVWNHQDAKTSAWCQLGQFRTVGGCSGTNELAQNKRSDSKEFAVWRSYNRRGGKQVNEIFVAVLVSMLPFWLCRIAVAASPLPLPFRHCRFPVAVLFLLKCCRSKAFLSLDQASSRLSRSSADKSWENLVSSFEASTSYYDGPKLIKQILRF